MYAVTDRYSENIAKNVHFTSIAGSIALKDGSVFEFSDKDILENSLSINSKMNSAGEFKMGGVYASELSMTLMDFSGKVTSLDRAAITAEFRLHTDSGFADYDTVPLGTYYIDGSTVKRKDSGRVSFKAADGLMLFDKRCVALTGTLFYLVTAACTVCGVEFGMTEEELAALPNGDITVTIDTTRVQTWRDLLGYIAAITGGFARISRLNKLEFVPITCEKDENNHIIPVREVLGTVRFDTDFSDSYEQITKIVMMRNSSLISSTIEFEGSNSENYLTVELLENPLLSAFSDEEAAAALDETVRGVYRCHSRAFSSAFSGDPALDVGDYVKLRKGDTSSGGYSTGMITMQTWRYRGKHSIGCSMPSSVSSDTESRVQPKSQTEKRIDALEASIKTSGGSSSAALTAYEYLTDLSAKCNGVTYTAETDADTGLISKITASNGGELVPEVGGTITDITLHNAVLFAVAMAKGLTAPAVSEFMPVMSGVHGYFDYKLAGAVGSYWANQISGGEPFTLVGGTDTGDCLRLDGKLQEYGYYDFAYGDGDDQTQTIYYVARCKPAGNTTEVAFGGMANTASSSQSEISFWARPSRIAVGTRGNVSVGVSTREYADGYSVTAVRKQNGALYCFGDGVYKGSTPQTYDLLPRFTIGGHQRDGKMIWLPSGSTAYQNAGVTDVLFVALSNDAHSDADILTNLMYLTKRFNI